VDLKGLTKEQKLHLLDLFEERDRRLREKKSVYAPNEGQQKVHVSPARERFVFSGNGAGKTALGVNEVIWWANGYNPITKLFSPVPCRIIVLLDSPDKVGDVWIPELRKWTNVDPEGFDKRGRPYVSRIGFKNGSELLFMFHGQETTLFESLELDYLVCDEPPPRSIYVALMRGARKKGRKPRFLIIGTPLSAAWLRTEVYEPWSRGERPDVECFKFGTVVNTANLADDYIENYSRTLSEKERRIRFEGEFFDLEGLALAPMFNRPVHVIPAFEWYSDAPVIIAIDPHPTKAHHAVMLGTDRDNNNYVLRSLRAKQVARDFARTLRDWMVGYRVVDIVSDSLGSSEGTGGEGFMSFIQVLRDEGIKVRATTWKEKSDEDFIERIRDVLHIPEEMNNYGQRLPKLRIFEGNNGLISDIENVQWVKYRDLDEYRPKLDISNRDFLSCLKYALAANPHFEKARGAQFSRARPVTSYGQKPKTTNYFRDKLNGR